MLQQTYYGRIEDSPPKLSLDYYMLDDYIEKILHKHSLKFKQECSNMIKDLKKDALVEIKMMKQQIKILENKAARIENRPPNMSRENEANQYKAVKAAIKNKIKYPESKL